MFVDSLILLRKDGPDGGPSQHSTYNGRQLDPPSLTTVVVYKFKFSPTTMIGGDIADDSNDELSESSIWGATEQTAVRTKQKWSFVARLIPDFIFVGVNFVCLLVVVTYSNISPGIRLGNAEETAIVFVCGFGGFSLVYFTVHYFLFLQSISTLDNWKGAFRTILFCKRGYGKI